ncbi:uncharacterized protein LOC144647362 [Oculina patagonica]
MDGWCSEEQESFIDGFNHRFSFLPRNAVLQNQPHVQPLFQPGHFFAPQQIHFIPPTPSNNPGKESSKGKANEKQSQNQNLQTGAYRKQKPSACVSCSFRKTEVILSQSARSNLERDLRELQEQL